MRVRRNWAPPERDLRTPLCAGATALAVSIAFVLATRRARGPVTPPAIAEPLSPAT